LCSGKGHGKGPFILGNEEENEVVGKTEREVLRREKALNARASAKTKIFAKLHFFMREVSFFKGFLEGDIS